MMKILLASAALILLGAGCTGPRCIKQHEVQSTCVMPAQHMWLGKFYMQTAPAYTYDCMKTVCDEYETEATE